MTHNRCTECQRDMQVILPGEKPNPRYVCTDCRGKPQTCVVRPLSEMLKDNRLMWRARFTALGIKVARRGFLVNRGETHEELFYGRALDLIIRDRPDRQTEAKYSFHLNLDTGEWNRAGMSVKTKTVFQTWFKFDTLKRYGLEAVIAK